MGTALDGFIALINALAWPSASLAIAILFRRELRMALGRLGQLKYGGVELTFREDLRQAETLARSIPRPEINPGPANRPKITFETDTGNATELAGTMVAHDGSTATTVAVAAGGKNEPRQRRSLDSYWKVCQVSPRLGVLETWDELKQVLVQVSSAVGDRRVPAPIRLEAAVRFLVERGWLTSDEGQLIERLRLMANQVEPRDGTPVMIDDARRFVELAVPLIDRVTGLT